jgi:hypothetical protein
MVDPTLSLPLPHAGDYRDNRMWVDEQIWGHRLWDSESPWLLFLEFLNVAEACHREGRLFDEKGVYYPLVFHPYQRIHLRNVLFNNEALDQVVERFRDNTTAWSRWLAWMADNAKGATPREGLTSRDFSYLKERFHSFGQFAVLVGMLQGSAVENETNKRWSSRFVFPFGPNALYEDLNISPSGAVSREYINFGRTGELLYLMISRSARAGELAAHFGPLLAGNNPWNKLLALLEPEASEDRQTRTNSFLPYRRHAAFDRLGEDWLRILELDLPGFDALPYLVTLGALHVLLYQLRVAAELVDMAGVHFVCELVAPRKTLVRELSALNYQENNQLPQKAVETYLAQVPASEDWQRALAQPGAFAACKRLLIERVRWPQDAEDYEGCSEPDALFAELRREAVSRHRQHVANVHRNYGRDVGLVSRRGTNRLRYAPTDALLKALILANVERRTEFKEFLARLFARYGFVFGEREAEQVLGKDDFDKKAFQANSHRLEQRLGSLGMLRRLSDACAYVQNPFAQRAS